jgi:Flp pilus assembly protein TadG
MTGTRAGRRSGSAVIELALSLPVLVGLFLGTLQFGYAFFIYNELEQSVRAGARYASMRKYSSLTATPDNSYTNAVCNVVVYANPAGGTEPVAPGLTTAQVLITVTMQNGAPATVSVAIDGYRLPQVISAVLLTRKPATQFPYLGVFAPPAS